MLYHYGELGPEEAAELEGHLEGCGSCRAAMEELRDVLGALPPHVPPQGEVLGAVRAVRERLEPRTRPLLRRLAPAVAAAAVAAMAVVVMLRGRPETVTETLRRPPEEYLMVAEANQELLENMELLETMDMLQDMELADMVGELEARSL